jgi:ataxia telangiectasia mutated family protein
LKAKTLEAVIDHITQTLPNADGEYCEPIAQHYLKALSILLERRASVEHLKSNTWLETVEFCLQGIDQYLDNNDVEPSGLSRSLAGLGAGHLSGPLTNSTNGTGRTQSQLGSVSRQNAEDLLQILSYLVSAPNFPLLQKCDAIVDTIIRFLSSQGSTISQLQKLAFSILNTLLSFTREDRNSLSKDLAQKAIPIICRFWQGKSVAKDEMLSSVRDEMLILLFLVHLHLERNVMDDPSNFTSNLNDLLDVVRAEYARRSERDQLQLEDIDIADLGAVVPPATPFQLNDFRLRLHNTRAERNWANLVVIGILERLVSLGHHQKTLTAVSVDEDADKHPRKRQRTAQSSDRLLGPLKSEDQNVRLAGLQILPFVLQQSQLSAAVLTDLLDQLTVCATDKRGSIASWSLLAIAR